MEITSRHFNIEPASWQVARPWILNTLEGSFGSQGHVFECIAALEGVVAKLYRETRSAQDLSRVKSLILACKRAASSEAAKRLFERCNVPLRPILSPAGEFGGVFLPPIPSDVNRQIVNVGRGRTPKAGAHMPLEAQHLVRDESPFGLVRSVWRWKILASLAETVAVMHSMNLIHGDLSLSNVLVRRMGPSDVDDEVYLLDVDDAFSGQRTQVALRKSPKTFDPSSVAAHTVSYDTDVYVVALWVIAFTAGRFVNPMSIEPRMLTELSAPLRALDAQTATTVCAALGPLGSRPTILELYDSIRATFVDIRSREDGRSIRERRA